MGAAPGDLLTNYSEISAVDVSTAFLQLHKFPEVSSSISSSNRVSTDASAPLHPALINLPRQYLPECGQVYMANQVTPPEPKKGTQKIVLG